MTAQRNCEIWEMYTWKYFNRRNNHYCAMTIEDCCCNPIDLVVALTTKASCLETERQVVRNRDTLCHGALTVCT